MSLAETAASVSGAFDSIPIIDIGHASTPEERAALARQIRDACMNVGFFYISNHGIPQETIGKVCSAMEAYFSLPLETKMKLYHRDKNFRGYEPVFSSNADPANRADLHEGFIFGWEELVPKENDEKRTNDGAMAGANVWPSEPSGFREACLNYYHAAVGVGRVLFHLFALALDLPATYFDDKTKNSAASMRLIHYPPQTGPEGDGIVGIGAHSDFRCFTILWQEPDIQALELLNSEKQWVKAPPIPGTLVINIGDQLARWTNDVFRSTVHRAINRSGVRRYSIPLFFGTDYHVQIEPMPSCVSPERPPKYEPVAAGDYVHQRLQEVYYQDTATS
ncbi:hypothetical protein F5J12DRAFT_530309 [Pisolithus orientalis]|uniref:uncharacterized protein n=1 Tax=Pisolithus orientalis TaxID=936130 RepID=UPI002225473C|nr:uncharacterized protein F5J12DRAFT_530257 [Pisolithus orientalis]XP_051594780.1 uncharacterized protein F5J12DRAFT_530309 [Pisolithus orientalis]KAI5988244.1 hypothetical protein F5J12DRAFT_530257 [Pisolithus orientalis]KAI5988248.1 hypothetical protein F5J12DRAFT_530309 [Pisolithus orientalis]